MFIQFIMNDQIRHLIHTSKYQLQTTYFIEKKTATLHLMLKTSNYPLNAYDVKLSELFQGEEGLSLMRSIRRYRNINVLLPQLAICILLKQQHHFSFNQIALESEFRQQKLKQLDEEINMEVKYWNFKKGQLEISIAFDPHNQQILIRVIEKGYKLRIGQTAISQNLLLRKKSPLKGAYKQDQILYVMFKAIINSTTIHITWESHALIAHHEFLKQIPLSKVTIIQHSSIKQENQLCPVQKILLFKHIFLTQIITYMIQNQFGRRKRKFLKNREGYQQPEYIDEEFEELRSWGYRFSQFNDYPFKLKKIRKQNIQPKNQSLCDNDNDSTESDEQFIDEDQTEGQNEIIERDSEDQQDKKKEEKNQQRQQKEKSYKKKTKLRKMKEKIKKLEGICNFTLISDKQKSKINSMRFCLYQMTRETDKTKGLIDFLILVFKVYPKQQLVGNGKGKEMNKIAFFMNQFKVKRQINLCIKEYTRQSFFYRILNIGLRVLKKPYELIYLRLPFSHLFWSIKLMYHRHKRAIFDESKRRKENRNIFLYRGFEIQDKEIKKLKKRIGGYIEAQGFLSTSQSEQRASAFAVNGKIIINIPVSNLRGTFDNGFSQISLFSEHMSERQILINAFNIFKIISIRSEYNNDMQLVIHTLTLQYGSLKTVEKKIEKSENLLEAEFFWQENKEQLQRAREKLQSNKEEMSQKQYHKLSKLLPKAEQQLKRRKEQLKEWSKEEYQQKLSKLSEWEKELIMSTKHQQLILRKIQNYGDLLFMSNQFRRASIYLSREIKQLEMGVAIEGIHWRKSQYLTQKLTICRSSLYKVYEVIGRSEDSFIQGNKLLHEYKSLNFPQNYSHYYNVLFDMYVLCDSIVNKADAQKQYKAKLMKILDKYQLYNSSAYKKMMQRANKDKKQQNQNEQGGQDEEEKRKRKKVKEMKQQLKQMESYTYGKYNIEYLRALKQLIRMLHKWQQWAQVVEQAEQYFDIRAKCPQTEHRRLACNAFMIILQSCIKIKAKQHFSLACSQMASFMTPCINNYLQIQMVRYYLEECLKLQWCRPATPILLSLINCPVQCKLQEFSTWMVVMCGYVLLVLNLSRDDIVKRFLQWGRTLYQQQQYTHCRSYKSMVSFVIDYNEKGTGLQGSRMKDYEDSKIIKYIRQFITGSKAQWREFVWEESRAQLTAWHHPFHPFNINMRYVWEGINIYFRKGDLVMVTSFYRQGTNIQFHMLDKQSSKVYLLRLGTLCKLHLNDYQITSILSLLSFCPFEEQNLQAMLVQLGIDLAEVIMNTHHMCDVQKHYNARFFTERKEALLGRRMMPEFWLDPQVRRVQKVVAPYKHFRKFTNARRLKLSQHFMLFK